MLALLPTLLLLVPAAEAYFILNHATLVQTRLDPIISPGSISQHEHTILGGSKFSQDYDYETMLTSECTTAPVNIDMSSYWAPSLYYYDPSNDTFEAIPAGAKTYYLQRPGDKNEAIVAPPPGLRMTSGNPYRRDYNASSFADQAVSFVCLDYYNDHSGDPAWEQRNNFFEHNCPDGMRAQVFFPQCWDGKSLYEEDMSHMAFPVDTFQGGNCPSTHPVHIIGIFYEFIFQVGDFPFNDANEVTWVLANGDTTGYGFHGDFTMGWPSEGDTGDVLQNAIDTCGLETGGDVSACEAFAPYLDFSGGCKPEMPIVNEDNGLGSPISKLPGNNPIWIGNGTKPSDPNYNTTSPGFKAVKAVLPDGWSRTGCIAEGTSGRALSAASYASDDMTLTTCAAYCGALLLPYAGVEYGRECYCSTEYTENGATGELVSDELCNFACPGLETDSCGGSSHLSLMTNPSLFFNETAFEDSLPGDWSVGPCVTDTPSSRTLQGGYWADSSSMTNQACVSYCSGLGYSYAGTVYSQECYCANFLTSTAEIADEEGCSMPCKGDIRQDCGGSNFMSLFTNHTVSSTGNITIVDGQLA